MSLLSMITHKSLLYAVGVVALLLLLSNLGWWAHASALGLQRDVAVADADVATATRDAARTEMRAWKNKARELAVANLAAQKTVDYLQLTLKQAQAEKLRLRQEGERAIAAAQADAVDADRTLKEFMSRYAQQLGAPDCAGAMATVQLSCPAMEGY